MAKLLKLTISRVDQAVFSDDVQSLNVPGTAGEMTILANHEALISTLKPGIITIKKADGETETFNATEGGTLEINNNHASVLI